MNSHCRRHGKTLTSRNAATAHDGELRSSNKRKTTRRCVNELVGPQEEKRTHSCATSHVAPQNAVMSDSWARIVAKSRQCAGRSFVEQQFTARSRGVKKNPGRSREDVAETSVARLA